MWIRTHSYVQGAMRGLYEYHYIRMKFLSKLKVSNSITLADVPDVIYSIFII